MRHFYEIKNVKNDLKRKSRSAWERMAKFSQEKKGKHGYGPSCMLYRDITTSQYLILPLGTINQQNQIWKMTRTIPKTKILQIGLKTIRMMDARDKISSTQTKWTILISSVLMPVESSIAPSTSLAMKINRDVRHTLFAMVNVLSKSILCAISNSNVDLNKF